MKSRLGMFLKKDKRYITILKAVLLALLPVLCAMARCAWDGHTIGQTYLPACEWNDELFYYKQVESIIHYGFPQGYYGFNESHGQMLSFAAWSPVLVWPWVLWGLLFGWNLMSPIICNIVLLSLTCFGFVLLVRPTWKQEGVLIFLFCLFTPFSRYLLSCMPEIICFSMLILFYGVAFSYQNRQTGGKLCLLFGLSALMTLMRPYLLLFMLLPVFWWWRRSKWKGLAGSAVVMAVTLFLYYLIKHFLGAEYFAPLFFTDWVEAFFQGGLFEGIRFTCGKLYYMGRSFLAYMLQGVRTGLASGAYFAGYMTMFGIILIQCVQVFRRWRKGSETEKKSTEGQLTLYAHLAFSFFAMLIALLLMYKLTEGSKHLLTFLAGGIFVVAMMDTKTYKKAVVLGVVFTFFYRYMAVDPMDYQVPFMTQELEAKMNGWDACFQEKMRMSTEKSPTYDNTIIWVLSDSKQGETIAVKWQYLYALPDWPGISCCTSEYVEEHFDTLSAKYIATLAGGRIDTMCEQRGYELIGKDDEMAVYCRF